MNIALRSEDWQLCLAASTIQQCSPAPTLTIQRLRSIRMSQSRRCSSAQQFNAARRVYFAPAEAGECGDGF